LKDLNNIFDKYRLTVIFIAICPVIVMVFTSFNITGPGQNAPKDPVLSTIVSWYDLYLELEERDSCSYPPIAARRASELGLTALSIQLQEFNDHRITDTIYGLLLSEAFAFALLRMFDGHPTATARIKSLQHSQRIAQNASGRDIEYAEYIIDECIKNNRSAEPTCSTSLTLNSSTLNFQDTGTPSLDVQEILPNWKYQPVYISSNSFIDIPPPPCPNSYNSPELEGALAVYYTSKQLTEEQKWIADFWSDDFRGLTFSPSDRWISIAVQLIRQKQIPSSKALELLAKLGVGLNDAVTLCWKFKYDYNISRPQPIINQHIDPQWTPYHDNPAFPSYPSGHAVIGSVACTILSTYFGNDISFTDRSHEDRVEFTGRPRNYSSFTEMEYENAVSRIYMGVHYPADCEEGVKLGRQVGLNVISLSDENLYYLCQ
jgi:hypothetical protein